MEAGTYRCWAEHEEDLTAKVLAAVRAGKGGPIMRHEDAPEDDERREIVVRCSEGHPNVFEV
jgi:hypothetical protein